MRKVQFSLKHYCISETGSERSKTYAKTVCFAYRILLPHLSLVESRNLPDTAHTNISIEQLPVTKKLSAVFGNLMRKEELYE